ncbi:MAG: hypothetical protein FJZ09_06510 [Candidatus Omnitrophica bacterium]|nr:hypothetical protein [Candidatus Omnitrophota bacterium]
MERLKKIIPLASLVIFLICLYSFLHGNKVFEKRFENDYVAWYFLAKGIFCSLALYILGLILSKLCEKQG